MYFGTLLGSIVWVRVTRMSDGLHARSATGWPQDEGEDAPRCDANFRLSART